MKTTFTTLIGVAALATSVSAQADGSCTSSGTNFRTLTSGETVASTDRGSLCDKLFSAMDGICATWPDSSTVTECNVNGDSKLEFKINGDPADCSNDQIEHVWAIGTDNSFGEVHCP